MERVRAKVFAHGGSQAVRLPKAFRVDTPEVWVSTDGSGRVVLEPVRSREDEVRAMFARIDALLGENYEWPDPPADPPPQERDWTAILPDAPADR